MASNGLVKKLKNAFKKAVFIGTAFSVLSSASCKFPIPTPNNSPTAILSAAPTSGDAPLEILIQLDGADLDGKNDIIEYKIGQDKNNDGDIDDYSELIKNSSNPINEKITFNSSGIKKIYGQVMDSQSATGKAGPVLIDVSLAPGIPTVDLSTIPESEKNFNEESQTIINLPTPIDSNPEDNPVPYISATSLDGQVSIDDSLLYQNKIIVTGNLDKIDTYQIQLEFGSPEGGTNTATLEGIIHDCLDVKGQLQDNESDGDIPRKGIIKIYDSFENFLEQIQTDANGYFSAQLNKKVSEFPNGIIVQAGIDNDGNKVLESYVRTRTFSAGDARDLIIKAVPYPLVDLTGDENIDSNDIQDFRTHIGETNTLPYTNPEIGLIKWNLDNLTGIEILKYDPIYRGYNFSTNDQNIIERKINDPTDIRSYVEGRTLNVQKDITPEFQNSNKHYDVNPNALLGKKVVPHLGWIIVVPNKDIGAGGGTVVWDYYDRIIDKVGIHLGFVSEGLVSHEFGHAFVAPNTHAYTLPPEFTIMRASGNVLKKPGIADKKASKIVYEDTYQAGEKLDAIMALDFY